MSVSDGQAVNAAVTNAAFISRTTDSNTTGKLDLEEASSASITDVQKVINDDIQEAADQRTASGTSLGDTDMGVYTGSLTDNTDQRTINQELGTQVDTNVANISTNTTNISDNTTDISEIRTTQGTSDGDTNLGTFSGTIITDNVSVKTALQEIETSLEGITDGLDFQSTWDANANSPALVSSTGTKGHFYIVATAGSTNLDGITDWNNGDWAVFDGTVWRQVDNTDAVASVNSQTGAVVLDTDDIAEGTNKYNVTHTSEVVGSTSLSVDKTAITNRTQSTPEDGDFVMLYDASLDALRKADVADLGGGGSGQGGINHLITSASADNSNAEDTVGDWVTYDDGPSAVPVDGIGGSSSVSFQRTVTVGEVQRGDASFEFSKGIANVQGDGASVDFTIDPFDKGRQLFLTFDFDATHADYNNNDIRFFVYDVTNANLLNVLTSGGDGSLPSSKGRFTGSFTAASDSDSYRLIAHMTSTNNDAFLVFFDNFRIGPDATVNAPIVSKWRALDTPSTITNMGTVTGHSEKISQIGPNLFVKGSFTTGTIPGSGTANIAIPLSLTATADGLANGVGRWWQNTTSTSQEKTGTFRLSSNTLHFTDDNTTLASSGNAFSAPNATILFSNGVLIKYEYMIEVDEYDAGAILSTVQADHQTVTFISNQFLPSGSITVSTDTKIPFTASDVADDTHNIADPTNNRLIAPRTGYYFGSMHTEVNYGTNTQDYALRNQIRVAGSTKVNGASAVSTESDGAGDARPLYTNTSGIFFANAGDAIEFYLWTNGNTPTYNAGLTATRFTVHSMPDFTTFGVTGSGIKPTVQNYLSSDTYVKPIGLSHIKVTVVAGGGGGGGCGGTISQQVAVGGGGAAGGTAIKTILAKDLASSETVTVAGGGSGGAGGSGSTGGSSSFGSHCSATGGAPGFGGTAAGGAAISFGGLSGVGSSGDINLRGGDGQYGWGDGAAGNSNLASSGSGGGSSLSGDSRNAITTNGKINGTAGKFPGGGGAGGCAAGVAGSGGTSGGTGANGVIIVEEFYL